MQIFLSFSVRRHLEFTDSSCDWDQEADLFLLGVDVFFSRLKTKISRKDIAANRAPPTVVPVMAEKGCKNHVSLSFRS